MCVAILGSMHTRSNDTSFLKDSSPEWNYASNLTGLDPSSDVFCENWKFCQRAFFFALSALEVLLFSVS